MSQLRRISPFPDPELVPIMDLLREAGIDHDIREVMPVFDEIVIPNPVWKDRTITISPNINEDHEFYICVFSEEALDQGEPDFVTLVTSDYIETIPNLVKALFTL